MTETTTKTPARRLDLAALVKESKPTTVTTAGTLNGPENPFLDKVRESYGLDKQKLNSGWQEITITGEQFDDVVNSLRALSAWFGSTKNGKEAEPIGVHIRAEYQPDGADQTTEVGPKDFEEIPRDGREVFVKYTGRERLQRGRKSRRNDTPAGAATELTGPADDDDSELTPA